MESVFYYGRQCPRQLACKQAENNNAHGAETRFKAIERAKVFSVSLATDDMSEIVNFCGFVSGKDADKGERISHSIGQKLEVPVIDVSPWIFECSLFRTIEQDGPKIFIGLIENFQADESVSPHGEMPADGNFYPAKIAPMVSCLRGYYKVGEKTGECGEP